ncbi:unnamed protein product, partial [Iphiclides podalirius]
MDDGKMFCYVCGLIDEHYDEDSLIHHNATPKHICNKILHAFKQRKRYFSKNRDGAIVLGSGECVSEIDEESENLEKTDHLRIQVVAEPNQKVKFSFTVRNDLQKEDLMIVGIILGHPQPQFVMSNNPYVFGKDPHVLEKKTTLVEKIVVLFKSADIGQFEMPIIFTFNRKSDDKNIIIVRELIVSVSEEHIIYPHIKTPYTKEEWARPDHIVQSSNLIPQQTMFKIPKLLKTLLPCGIEEKSLEKIKAPREIKEKLQLLIISVRAILDTGPTKSNYMNFFHHLLWWEEIIAKINLKRYNMFNVTMEQKKDVFFLEVPGLAEKRPSLMRGDRVFIKPRDNPSIVFESSVKDLNDTHIQLGNMDDAFQMYSQKGTLFDIRFLLSRMQFERMHTAVNSIFSSKQECRLFPEAPKHKVPVHNIKKFYNPLIRGNTEQRSAVEHILAGSSGKAPYIVFGPPGTGKTMTIVEAIVQLVARNPKNRIMVCTDSNMAADHIAVMLLQYKKVLKVNDYLLRANSQAREWSVMPSVLVPVSNGANYETFYTVNNAKVSKYRIFVTTLLHAAKYGWLKRKGDQKLQMTHLFIDEAAQASEPATLVPITGLLAPSGQLVLAGDPQQLGPVVLSKEARIRGLKYGRIVFGVWRRYSRNYSLLALAAPDPLSRKSILNLPGGDRAIVFHAVNSREQRMGNAPSFFNEKELEMLKKYVKALLDNHQVAAKDIGIIAPYIRQVYKMKSWLTSIDQKEIEVGTVESFQGKEKRVILVSTVRANCRLLDYDAKYGLGFLVDDKRYNVTLTRAKAKLVIIGNPACLARDIKWRKYMGLCSDLNCYYGLETQQLERNSRLLLDISRTRFDMSRLSEELVPVVANNKSVGPS